MMAEEGRQGGLGAKNGLPSATKHGMVRGMKKQLIIPLEDFPETGRRFKGELDGSVFGIDDTGVVSCGSLYYELEVQLYDTEMVVRGYASAPFRLCCDRCLREFEYEAEAESLTLSFDVAGKAEQDITPELREEVILGLPDYPKCELVGQECEINDNFGDFRLDKDPYSGVNSATPSGKSVWDALDDFPGK